MMGMGKGIITTHVQSDILVILELQNGRFQPMQLRKHLGVDLINKPKNYTNNYINCNVSYHAPLKI